MAPESGTKPGSLNQMRKLQSKSAPKADGNATHAKQRRPNYHQIHSRPLPLTIYPLPCFLPQNPLSYLRIAFSIVSHLCYPPNSHAQIVNGYFDAATRSVHVSQSQDVRALWEMGFFGKGSLSRSEPTWLEQEKKRLGLLAVSTSEEMTDQRRKERERMKRERARIEQELLIAQIRQEQTALPTNKAGNGDISLSSTDVAKSARGQPASAVADRPNTAAERASDVKVQEAASVIDQEPLQLSLEEAFFLTHAIGILKIHGDASSLSDIFSLFRQHSYYPVASCPSLSSDDPFLLNYAVYHHYRSLGWVIREGVKFAVDYLLYESGPVFKHAAFAVIIVPSYSDSYWIDSTASKTVTQRRRRIKDWTWLHCVNRVQTQVLKTLVLCYIDIPSPEVLQNIAPGDVLRHYKIREFSISRWSANRNRD